MKRDIKRLEQREARLVAALQEQAVATAQDSLPDASRAVDFMDDANKRLQQTAEQLAACHQQLSQTEASPEVISRISKMLWGLMDVVAGQCDAEFESCGADGECRLVRA